MAENIVGAGDLGKIRQCVMDAIAAAKASNWGEVVTHLWHIVQEVQLAISDEPNVVGSSPRALTTEEVAKLEALTAQLAAAKSGAPGPVGAFDWKSILAAVLPLLLKLLV